MNGSQLKAYRQTHKLSLRDVAALLQNVSYSTISRWEVNNEELEPWVMERIMGKTLIPLPLETLHALMQHATETRQDFGALLAEAIRSYLASLRPVVPLPPGQQPYIADITPEPKTSPPSHPLPTEN